MPTTRRMAAEAEGKAEHKAAPAPAHAKKPASKKSDGNPSKGNNTNGVKKETENDTNDAEAVNAGVKRDVEEAGLGDDTKADEPPAKREEKDGSPGDAKPKSKRGDGKGGIGAREEEDGREGSVYQTGTIERGFVLFFYRPRVNLEEANSIDDVKNLDMVLIPRPPAFATSSSSSTQTKLEEDEDVDMQTLSTDSDALPAPLSPREAQNAPYRLLLIGRKKLPEPHGGPMPGSTRGGGNTKQTFWATILDTTNKLPALNSKLDAEHYSTKTRGERTIDEARLVAQGVYAIVNSAASVPSKRETHFGYVITHPHPDGFADVQSAFGIHPACSYVLQIKNPLAPSSGPMFGGRGASKNAEYPDWIMNKVFGHDPASGEHSKGREDYGLRFANCETPELLDYEHGEVLLIAAREDEEGLETSLGEGRGKALVEFAANEREKSIEQVYKEYGLDIQVIQMGPLEGKWE